MGNVKPLLVVTGTHREGAALAGPGVTVLPGGGDAARLAANLARLAPHACGIISYGTGGGLIADLRLGEMVIGEALTGALTGDCEPAWVQALARALPQARIGSVFADGTLLASIAEKRRAAANAAIIVDMESHLAAAAAAEHGLPFAILRCVSDTSEAALPPAVAVAMRPDGSIALGKVLGSVLRQPGQLPALIHTIRGFGVALAALDSGAASVGGRLSFDQR